MAAIRRGIRVNTLAKAVLGVLAFAAVLGVILTSSSEPATAQNQGQILFGAHPGLQAGETRLQSLDRLQSDLGRDLAVVRRFLRWEDDATTDPLISATLAQGSIPHISVFPRRNNGQPVRWDDIANAQPGEPLHNEIVGWANQISSFGQPVWFTFNHEPETVLNLDKGTAADYIDAWRKIRTVFDNEGVNNARYMHVSTAYGFDLNSNDRRHIDNWFPGEAWVDQIGLDPYNWGDCREDNDRWRPFEEIATPARDFAANYPSLGLVVAEFGSAEDVAQPNRKAQWAEEIRVLVNQPGWGQLEALIAFDYQVPGTNCEWWADSSAQSLAAYRVLANDPIFGGDGETPLPPPPPPPPPPTERCSVTVVGNEAQISWVDDTGREILRNNNNFVRNLANQPSVIVDQLAPGQTANYSVRVWSGGGFVDFPCPATQGPTPPPPPPGACSISVNGNQVAFTWSIDAGIVVLRRDGNWIKTPPAADTTYTYQENGTGTHDYSVRVWLRGEFEDFVCGSANF